MSPPRHTPSDQPGATHALGRLYDRLRRTRNRATTDQADSRRSGRDFACAAEKCVVDLMTAERPELVRHSADVLTHLLEIWAEHDVDAEDVWVELDRRTRMGNLLLALNMAERRSIPAGTRRRPWKIRTTKLP
ncbi:hypothetical protein DY926_11565 [Komagataeibacter melaceti]|uniref:Phosphoribosyl-ATP pyrophosphatase n=1 Tax=Komagataeibacter melaceti TaxID=2766577 RepID=A0A371YYS7_9PROT|nr:hypothetical protein [Komagataeibacter melaceti]RFD19386.1 hypothetical protein DY926_11565 [Komagataeibacter melaceti]